MERTIYRKLPGRAVVMGASSGLGMRMAQRLLNDGWTVGVAARRTETLHEMAAQHPGKVHVRHIDVNDGDAGTQLSELIAAMGGCDLYFHASGFGKMNTALDPHIELGTVRTNGEGFVRMITAAFRHMEKNGGGHIATITSIAGTKGLAPAPAYSATKAMQSKYIEALEQLANSQHLNISFTDIRPGFVRTDFISGAKFPMEMNADRVADDIYKAVMKHKHVHTTDWRWAIVVAFWRMIPKIVWRKLNLQKNVDKRDKK